MVAQVPGWVGTAIICVLLFAFRVMMVRDRPQRPKAERGGRPFMPRWLDPRPSPGVSSLRNRGRLLALLGGLGVFTFLLMLAEWNPDLDRQPVFAVVGLAVSLLVALVGLVMVLVDLIKKRRADNVDAPPPLAP
jgi:hypothetical protein